MFKYKKNIISNSKITEKVFFLGLILIDYVQKSEIIHKIILKKSCVYFLYQMMIFQQSKCLSMTKKSNSKITEKVNFGSH